MAAYNAGEYIKAAIDSLLEQSFENFECLVVDDGSTDDTSEQLSEFSDRRIKTVRLPINCGIATARNIAMKLAEGKYWAVMDADDIALPERLQKQVDYLEGHPEVHFLGARAQRIANSLEKKLNITVHPILDADIKAQMILVNGSAMLDPTTMARADFLRRYDLLYPHMQRGLEQALWLASVRRGANFANLDEMLLVKRRHRGNVTNDRDHSMSILKLQHELKRFEVRQQALAMYYPHLCWRDVTLLAKLLSKRVLEESQIAQAEVVVRRARQLKGSIFGESKPRTTALLDWALARQRSH